MTKLAEALMKQIHLPRREYRMVGKQKFYTEGDVSKTAEPDTNYMRQLLEDDAYLHEGRYKIDE